MNTWFKVIVLISSLFIGSTVQSQNKKTISRQQQFRIIDEDLLAGALAGANVDSLSCMQLLSIAQELNNDSLLAISYNWLGAYFDSHKGDNISAFEYYYKALPYALEANDKRRISSIYFDIATSYFDLNNNEEAMRNTRAGVMYLPDEDHPMYYWMLIQYEANMAQYFVEENIPDSALHYARLTMATNQKVNSVNMDYAAYAHLGASHSLLGNYEQANGYFSSAKALSDSVSRNQSTHVFYKQYLPHLINEKKYAEVENEARILLQEALEENNNILLALAATYLQEVFELTGSLDSAYYYSKLESEVNARIYNQSNVNKIQALELGESLRKIDEENQRQLFESKLRTNIFLGSSFTLALLVVLLFINSRTSRKAKKKVEKAYSELKTTQSQLIQSEKMASLGELTAGIAHEIQNPLNFVNNFSDLNKELVADLRLAVQKGDAEEIEALARDIEDNEGKIGTHGQRASSIVKGMLEHSRSGDGTKEPTDINALSDEYLRLAYHGFRAKDKSFNADFETNFDGELPKVSVVPQDIGRVLLNLINNAFHAVSDKAKTTSSDNYKPTVTVTTSHVPLSEGAKGEEKVQITVSDNGPGIPEDVKEKIFQPFFTTKPTGEGTGLGLSLSYDIVKKGHGGELTVESKPGEGSTFTVKLPVE